ncbi:hypothetical protein [Sediminibacterium goheungense]|uniref:Uncharacterized protein n=1 Tax=Sediminibacterium goheungense TaxID=1086393 RepID=A0A4V3C521_9BACT|nr:hypothetical protein [Sediminibacterium goheungense]TDO28138.1 hypothetical protein BC659_0198 [Sediminibacterium goheungense]
MNEFQGQIKELSKLIHNWNLINVASKSQLDDFSVKLLNALHGSGNGEKIKRIIESELCITYGLYNNEFDADILAEQIMQWQNK